MPQQKAPPMINKSELTLTKSSPPEKSREYRLRSISFPHQILATGDRLPKAGYVVGAQGVIAILLVSGVVIVQRENKPALVYSGPFHGELFDEV